jgi:predicted esterase
MVSRLADRWNCSNAFDVTQFPRGPTGAIQVSASRRRLTSALLLLSFAGTRPVVAVSNDDGQIVDQPDGRIYLPTSLVPRRRHPLVVVYSPVADADYSLQFWQQLAERRRLIVYASKTYRNEAEMTIDEWHDKLNAAKRHIDAVLARFPVDRQQVLLTGFSGGASFAQCMNLYFPDLAQAVIPNSGRLWDFALQDLRRNPPPRAKRPAMIAMLASPTDFRYPDMQRDYQQLKQWGYRVGWLEFPGGHVLAPLAAYDQALAWVLGAAPGAR